MFVELKKSFLGRAAGERIDVSEDDARQLVGQGTAVAVADDLIGPAVTRALDAALARAGQLGDTIDAAVNQSLKAFADAQTLARKHAVPGHLRGRRRTAIRTARPSATGAWPSPAAIGTISKSTTAAASSSTPARPPWPRPAASPAATPCRPSSTSSS